MHSNVEHDIEPGGSLYDGLVGKNIKSHVEVLSSGIKVDITKT